MVVTGNVIRLLDTFYLRTKRNLESFNCVFLFQLLTFNISEDSCCILIHTAQNLIV